MDTIETKRLVKWASFAVLMLSIFLLAETLNAFKDWQTADAVYNSISVTGTGEYVSVPDLATFSFSVSADNKDVSTAQDSVTKSTDTILAGLKDLGIADTDIKTTDYSVYPKYTYSPVNCPNNSYCPPGNQIPDGYTVSQSVSVKVRKTADAGKALALVGSSGATNISGLTFTTDNPTQNDDMARANAITDAKARAQVLAKSLGVTIVRVVGYADNTQTPGPIFYAAGMATGKATSASAPTVPAGENKTTANVTVTYEIR